MSSARTNGSVWIALTLAAPLVAASADLQVRVVSASGAPAVDAIVYAVPATAIAHSPLPHAVIDQINRQFTPRVNVVQAGTPVDFPNSDNIRHSVYSFSPAKVFTLKLYAGKPAEPIVFDKPGLVVLGCNIHDRMLAWLLVVDTPYYARTDRSGTALLSKLPAGDYSLHAWHTPLTEDQQVEQPIKIDAAGPASARTLQFDTEIDSQEDMQGMKP